MTDYPTVAGPKEWGARGMAALTAKYGLAKVDEWRRKGGRPKDKTLLEIREEQREAERSAAATRRARRLSTKSRRSPSTETRFS